MRKSLLKYKNYEVHSITTIFEGKMNANIATWVMQSAMRGKFMTVALYEHDYTIELVRKSKILNINLLSEEQTALITKLGRKSGRDTDKFKRLPYALDNRNCPYLTQAIGFIQCTVLDEARSGDHTIFTCPVIGQFLLHPNKKPMTYHFLQEKRLVRS
ncbi:MAG: flavin reductase family protein [Cytophagales bacterium]|nr:flavin reductase family protein [Cytophagales bacterium]MDW8383324.1 flavin reductase family protein [Flammeovirgaceae bacterium]